MQKTSLNNGHDLNGHDLDKAQAVVRLVAHTLGKAQDEIGADASMANTPAWDSFEHMNICLAFEQKFGVKLTMDNIISATSINALADLVP